MKTQKINCVSLEAKTACCSILKMLTCVFLLASVFRANAAGYWDPSIANTTFDCSFYTATEIPGPIAATNGDVYAIRNAGSSSGNTGTRVMHWNSSSGWSEIGAFARYDFRGNGVAWGDSICIKSNFLYLGGFFDTCYPNGTGTGVLMTNIVKYDLTTGTWSQVGDGSITGAVTAILVDKSNHVFACQMGVGVDIPHTNLFVMWDGTSWNYLQGTTHPLFISGNDFLGGGVNSLVSDGTNFYLGGYVYDPSHLNVTACNGTTNINSPGVIQWNGKTSCWEGIMSPNDFNPEDESGPGVYSLALLGDNLFVAGVFADYSGLGMSADPSQVWTAGLYRYNTVTKQKLLFVKLGRYTPQSESPYEGQGEANVVVRGTDLFVVGSFGYVYDCNTHSVELCRNVVKWDGLNWSTLDSGIDGCSGPFYEAGGSNAVYFAGAYSCVAGGYESPEMARWVAEPSMITTYAGNYNLGGTYSGDGGNPLSAGLSFPTGLAFDGSGDLFIADTWNMAIREVANNVITSPAVASAPVGVALDANFNLYVANLDNAAVLMWQPAGNGSYEQTPIFIDEGSIYPQSMAIDGSGNLYFVNQFIDQVDSMDVNQNLATVAGNGTTGYSGDNGPAAAANLNVDAWYDYVITSSATVDSQGNLYIADMGNNVIRRVDATTGYISTVAGNYSLGAGYSGNGGSAINAQLSSPSAVAIDAQGNLYIADTGNNVIRRVSVNGIITTAVGNGTAGYSGDGGAPINAELNSPAALTFDASGNLYISDSGNNVIRKVSF